MTLYDLGYLLLRHVGVPDVVRVDKDDGTLPVAAGTGVAEHGRRRYTAPVHLLPESFEQLAAAPGAAAPLARGGAHEDLA